MLNPEVKRVDPQERVHIPSDWRRAVLGESDNVIIVSLRTISGSCLDVVKVDVSPEFQELP
jgi:DNA-binding transcriptional regulator/RsmH inhibitor MraZ